MPDFAVVTTEDNVAHLKKLFDTPLVFTASQIKGLEYKTVLVYGPFDEPAFEAINTLFNAAGSSKAKTNTHRAKKGEGHEQYGPVFNEVYTAFTRAKKRLIVVQQPRREIRHIIAPLKQSLTATDRTPAPVVAASKVNIEEQWFTEAKV